MARIKINKDRCKGCMLCVSVCPKGLITCTKKLNKGGMHYVEFRQNDKHSSFMKGRGECTACSMCAIICPDVCIEVYK